MPARSSRSSNRAGSSATPDLSAADDDETHAQPHLSFDAIELVVVVVVHVVDLGAVAAISLFGDAAVAGQIPGAVGDPVGDAFRVQEGDRLLFAEADDIGRGLRCGEAGTEKEGGGGRAQRGREGGAHDNVLSGTMSRWSESGGGHPCRRWWRGRRPSDVVYRRDPAVDPGGERPRGADRGPAVDDGAPARRGAQTFISSSPRRPDPEPAGATSGYSRLLTNPAELADLPERAAACGPQSVGRNRTAEPVPDRSAGARAGRGADG
ncbi:hypothetical protein RHRU231_920006 [Rhodococcus ruber]|uniref:Uncharacterized protein n=1 Tax=Rhodococcus ruber TaxID=1830 RepID=A0A098BTR3_9NOCA|nr:hypothetical protein RHRU231_920006 [Rhodococcus ruber]